MKRNRDGATAPMRAGRLPRTGEIVATRYRIVAPLGTGGYGTVFRAHDLKLDLPVALKFLHGAIGPDQAAWEARFGRAVVHPAIARIHDLGVEAGVPYLVMELVEGPTLSDDLVERGPCSPFQALYLLDMLCPALHTASRKGMLHGDLKPSNIMERADGGLVLVDFGTALLLSRTDTPTAGTPAYMAPEVLEGGRLTEASEIYSLGACVYELLTGTVYHDINPATVASEDDGAPDPMDGTSGGAHHRLLDLTRMMLRPAPGERPHTFRQVRDLGLALARDLAIERARTVLAGLWSGSLALLLRDPARNPDLSRFLLSQRPITLIRSDDQQARDFLGTAPGPAAGGYDPDIPVREYHSEAELPASMREAGAGTLLVIGPLPASWGAAAVSMIVGMAEREMTWSALRNPSTDVEVIPLSLRYLEEASSTLEPRTDKPPGRAPGGGPYTMKSHRAFRPLSHAMRGLVRFVLEHPVTMIDGADASGRTSLVRAGLFPVMRSLGWETVYLPRLSPPQRLQGALHVPRRGGAAGCLVALDDHRQWPRGPEWPWVDEQSADHVRALAGQGSLVRLVLITQSAHVMEALHSAAAADVAVARQTLPQPDPERVLEAVQRAGARPELAERITTGLLEDGWLPFELQRVMDWISRNPEARSTDWSLARVRKTHLNDAFGAISLRWQEPARRIIAALATGKGRATMTEIQGLTGMPPDDSRALARKLISVRMLRGVWWEGHASLEIPRPFISPVLELMGPEFVEARALRQLLGLELSLSESLGTRVEGPRLALLRTLADSGMLDESERSFLAAQTAYLREEEAAVEAACEVHALAEARLAAVREALRSLPSETPLSTVQGYQRASELASEVARCRDEAAEAWKRASLVCQGLLVREPANERAQALLATLHWRAMSDAESQALWGVAAHHRDLTLLYGGQASRQRLSRGCGLMVDCHPRAALSLWRLVDRDGQLVKDGESLEVATPATLEGLASGPWVAVLRAPGHAAATLAFNLCCDSEERLVARLFRAAWLGDDMVHVPAGAFRFGGDSRAPGAGFEHDQILDDFFLSRFPVTFRQYCEFLDELPSPGDDLIPRAENGQPLVVRTSEGRHLPVPGRLRLDPAVRYRGTFELEVPVVGVTWEAACHYCRWLGEQERRAYRLPREVEWEKAARAGQGRAFPWGALFSPRRCKMRDSRSGPPGLEPVGVFRDDVSAYGIQDLAGGVSEWCSDLEAGLLGLRVVRGGSWISSADQCRAAARHALPEEWLGQWVGFRVCFSPDDGA